MARYTKREIKSMVKSAYKLAGELKCVQVVFEIYANGLYILDTEQDNIIDIVETEGEAIELCTDINSGEFSDGIKSDCYYKPRLIDKDSGEYITRLNVDIYKK